MSLFRMKRLESENGCECVVMDGKQISVIPSAAKNS
jgi:hypothetical protein